MNAMNDDLKPCPFCGAGFPAISTELNINNTTTFTVGCTICGAKIHATHLVDSQTLAFSKWNSRPTTNQPNGDKMNAMTATHIVTARKDLMYNQQNVHIGLLVTILDDKKDCYADYRCTTGLTPGQFADRTNPHRRVKVTMENVRDLYEIEDGDVVIYANEACLTKLAE